MQKPEFNIIARSPIQGGGANAAFHEGSVYTLSFGYSHQVRAKAGGGLLRLKAGADPGWHRSNFVS